MNTMSLCHFSCFTTQLYLSSFATGDLLNLSAAYFNIFCMCDPLNFIKVTSISMCVGPLCGLDDISAGVS